MKEGDIVTLVLEGAEQDAEVVKTYPDHDYVDVKVVGGPNHGVLYQTVLPRPKAGEGSIRHFDTKPAAEQKEIRREQEPPARAPEPASKK